MVSSAPEVAVTAGDCLQALSCQVNDTKTCTRDSICICTPFGSRFYSMYVMREGMPIVVAPCHGACGSTADCGSSE